MIWLTSVRQIFFAWQKFVLALAVTLPVVFAACQNDEMPVQDLLYRTAERENSPTAIAKPYVIMISLDGFRADYLQKYRPPFLVEMAKKGALAEGLIPTYPTLTFPNHISLITGRYAENHGIMGNFFYDEQRNENYKMNESATTKDATWYAGEPLWAVAERNGMLAATCFWVGSEAGIDGVTPTYVRPYEHDLPNRDRVDQVLRWLALPEAQRPHFIALYFHQIDTASHKYGPESEQVQQVTLDIDAALARLQSEVERSGLTDVTYLFVSDHGMDTVKKDGVVNVNESSDNEILRGLLPRWKGGDYGAIATLYLDDDSLSSAAEAAEVEQVVKLLRAQPSADKFQVFKRAEIPADWHYRHPTKTGDIVLAAKPGYYLKVHDYSRGQEPSNVYRGHSTHGWPTSLESMQGLFLASGNAVKEGQTLKPFSNVHVYPFVLNVLGMHARRTFDGDPSVLAGILK